MTWPDDVAEYLKTEYPDSFGGTLFIGHLPDDPDTAIAIFPYAGQPIDRAVTTLGRFRLQFRVRGETFAAARSLSTYLITLLHGLQGTTMNSSLFVQYVEALGGPESMGMDGLGRELLVINMEFTVDTSTM